MSFISGQSVTVAGILFEPADGTGSSFLISKSPEGTVQWSLEVEHGFIEGVDSLQTGELVVLLRAEEGCTIQGLLLEPQPQDQVLLTIAASDGTVTSSLVIPGPPALMRFSMLPDGRKLFFGVSLGPGTITFPSGPLALAFQGFFCVSLDQDNSTMWSAQGEGGGFFLPRGGDQDGNTVLQIETSAILGDDFTILGETFSAPDSPLGYNSHLISVSPLGEVLWRLSPSPNSVNTRFGAGNYTESGELEFISTQDASVQIGSISIPGPSSALVRVNSAGVPISHMVLDVENLGLTEIRRLPSGELLVTGKAMEGMQLGAFSAPNGSVGQPYVAEMDASGNWNWAYFFESAGGEVNYGSSYDGRDGIRLFGDTDGTLSVNGVPLLGQGVDQRGFYVRFARACMTVNATTIEPADCDAPLAGSVVIEVSGGDEPYTYSWSNGSTNAQLTGVDGGVHAVTVNDDAGCQEVEYFYVPGPVDQVGEVVGYFDGWPYFRPGIETNATAALWSSGCEGDSVRMTVVLDPRVTCLQGLLGVDLQSGDTLRLDMGAIDEQGNYQDRELVLITDVTANIGDTLCFQVELDVISNGATTTIDAFERCYPVVNSYDPNDKSVLPAGDGPEGRIPLDQEKLTYLVRFQNTGNAPAFDVHIDDTLDTDLDLMGLEVIASSHPMVLEIQDRMLRFRFDDINLPDSTSNEPESHGYVLYRIPIATGSNLGTQIRNTAYIYFDLNPAIITNTTLSTLSLEVGVDEPTDLVDRLTVHPNPTPGRISLQLDQAQVGGVIRLFDTRGSLVSQATINDTTTVVDLEGLQPGIYFVKVGARTARVVKMDPLGGTR